MAVKTNLLMIFQVDLQSVTHVDEYTDSKNYPYAFTITRTGHGPLVLAAETEQELKQWMVAIQILSEKLKSKPNTENNGLVSKEPANRRPSCPPRLVHWSSAQHINDLVNNNDCQTGLNGISSKHLLEPKGSPGKSNIKLLKIPTTTIPDYLVTVQPSDGATKNSLCGEYHMSIHNDEVLLRRSGTSPAIITWPLTHIRKFKSEDLSDGSNLVTLEGSGHCGEASGMYLFQTQHGRDLIDRVKEAVLEKESGEHQHEKELERLRAKPLTKAPSTPDLFNRVSPPRPVPRSPALSVASQPHPSPRTSLPEISNHLPQSAARPVQGSQPPMVQPRITNGSRSPPPLQPRLVPRSSPPEVPSRERRKPVVDNKKANAYLHLLAEDNVPESCSKNGDLHSAEICHLSLEDIIVPLESPSPKFARRKTSGLPPLPPGVHDRVSPPKTMAPPQLPPRHASRSPPPPPPRPQHTLGSNSSLVQQGAQSETDF